MSESYQQIILACLLLTLTSFFVAAEEELPQSLKLPMIFSDHAVLQQGRDLPVWGQTIPGTKVSVTLSCDSDAKLTFSSQVNADAKGNWKLTLPASDQVTVKTQPWTMTVSSNNKTLTVKDLLFGEVWVCSGQSNMEWSVGNSDNAEIEKKNANFPQIRHFKIARTVSRYPEAEFMRQASWTVCSPATVASFTGVGYFFARDIHEKTGWPIGLINNSWGGMNAQAFVSYEKLASVPELTGRAQEMDRARLAAKADPEELAKWQKLKAKYDADQAEIKDAIKTADTSDIATANYDDSAWDEMKLPAQWEKTPKYASFDGVGYFRLIIQIPNDWAGKNLQLSLGAVDDQDITYWNGKKIGETRGYSTLREYKVPGELVKAGQNILTVRCLDTGGGGGIYAGPLSVQPENMTTEKAIDLSGNWKFLAITGGIPVPQPLPPEPGRLNDRVGSGVFNAMVSPITKYAIRGALFYQGESNAGGWKEYRTLFPALIEDWREQWGYEFPFYWCQLANFMKRHDQPTDTNWARLREAQTMTLSLAKTGQAILIDIGVADDIHPRNKQDVGKRLGRIARHFDYGESNLIYSGPVMQKVTPQGNKLMVQFAEVGTGLKYSDDKIAGFAIAGDDGKYVWADAKITSPDTVELTANGVTSPVMVRYAWADNPLATLYNSEDLPAVPFRSDKIGD